jgi:hypothetical protein
MSNAKLWDAIGDYADTYADFLLAKPHQRHKEHMAFETAQKRIIELIGKRDDDEPEKVGGNYDPADYA